MQTDKLLRLNPEDNGKLKLEYGRRCKGKDFEGKNINSCSDFFRDNDFGFISTANCLCKYRLG
jgi:hypothetical protein